MGSVPPPSEPGFYLMIHCYLWIDHIYRLLLVFGNWDSQGKRKDRSEASVRPKQHQQHHTEKLGSQRIMDSRFLQKKCTWGPGEKERSQSSRSTRKSMSDQLPSQYLSSRRFWNSAYKCKTTYLLVRWHLQEEQHNCKLGEQYKGVKVVAIQRLCLNSLYWDFSW